MAWVKLDDQFFRHRKARAAGLAGRALYLAGLCRVAEQLSDGFIGADDLSIIAAEAGAKARPTAAKLVEVGLWEQVEGGWIVHNYLDWNPSAEEVLDKRRKRAEAGRKGGLKSKPPTARPQANVEANASANGEAKPKRNRTPSPYPRGINQNPLQPSAEAGGNGGRGSTAITAEAAGLELDSVDGSPDARALRAIDHLAQGEVQAAIDAGKCDSPPGLTRHVRQRLIDEHFTNALANARTGWTPRDIAARIENPSHRPQRRAGAA